jgi:hypothetical protein
MLVRKELLEGPAILCGSHALLVGRPAMSLAALLLAAFPDGDRRGADRRTEERRHPQGRRQGHRVGWLFETSRRGAGRRISDR